MMMFRHAEPATETDLFDSIATDLASEFTQIGEAIMSDMRDRLSVDVQYFPGPNGEIFVERSAPGEPPRRETQQLWESVQSTVEQTADVKLIVDSDCPYAPPLEYGAEARNLLPRPVWIPTFNDWADTFVERAVSVVNGHSTT